MSKSKLAEGSFTGQRTVAAAVRAVHSSEAVIRFCRRVNDELDDITDTGGRPNVELSDEDSAVIVVAEAIAAHKS